MRPFLKSVALRVPAIKRRYIDFYAIRDERDRLATQILALKSERDAIIAERDSLELELCIERTRLYRTQARESMRAAVRTTGPTKGLHSHQEPRVAIVSVTVPPSPTGQSRVLGHLLQEADRNACILLTCRMPDPDSCRAGSDTYVQLPPLEGRAAHRGSEEGRIQPLPDHARLTAQLREEAREIAAHAQNSGANLVVACTGSPTHIPAAALACRNLELPLVAYLFDDPVFQWPQGTWRRFCMAHERIWSRQAAAVISPNEEMAATFRSRRNRDPVIVRNPVADLVLDHWTQPSSSTGGGLLRIVYTGTVYHAQADAFGNLMLALEQLNGAALLEVYTYQTADELAIWGLSGRFLRVRPFVDQTASYAAQRDAGVLFLPLAFASTIQDVVMRSAPAKLAEYLAAGRPILAHVPAGSFVANHLSRHGAGIVVDRPEPNQLAAALRQIIANQPAVTGSIGNALKLAQQYRASKQRAAFWDLLREVRLGHLVG